MDILVFLAVIAAAGLHAFWNSLLQNMPDKYMGSLLMLVVLLPISLPLALVLPLPAIEAWPFVLGGAALHVLYQLFLARAYDMGPFASVYPIARGSSPLFLLFATWLFSANSLNFSQTMAILLIVGAIMGMAWFSKRDSLVFNRVILTSSLVTGLAIASYSFVDGVGARLAGHSLAFYNWLVIFNILFMAFAQYKRLPDIWPTLKRQSATRFAIIGISSYTAYALVIWAFTQAPIALVSALRETSILFALLFAYLVAGERPNRVQVIGATTIAAGAMLIRIV